MEIVVMEKIKKKSNVKSFMKENEKKRPHNYEYTEGHKTFFVIISLYFFCVFLCVLWALKIGRRKNE